MSVLSDPKLMDKVRAADEAGQLCEFFEGLTRVVKKENRVRARAKHAAESRERYERMCRARGIDPR